MTTRKTATAPETATPTLGLPVVVTTAHRGVFFGYVDGPADQKTIRLQRGRNCVHWSSATRGFVGLAVTGPAKGSRVGPPATLTLHDVTSVAEASAEAVKAWEEGAWNS